MRYRRTLENSQGREEQQLFLNSGKFLLYHFPVSRIFFDRDPSEPEWIKINFDRAVGGIERKGHGYVLVQYTARLVRAGC